jgi:peroxiredoxin
MRITAILVGLAALGLALAAVATAAPDEKKEAAGAPGFTLPDARGNKVSLDDFKDKIVVLEWMNYDCPFSRRHYERGTFNALAAKYKDKGVVWLGVNSTHYVTAEKTAEFAEKHKAAYPILLDPAGDAGHAYGAQTTPHIFIIAGGKVVYNGGIDDDPGGDKPAAAVTQFVDMALGELAADKPVSIPETKPYGCSVKYKAK